MERKTITFGIIKRHEDYKFLYNGWYDNVFFKKKYKKYDVTTKNYISDILDVTFCAVFNSHTNSREVHLQPTNNFPFHLSLCVQPEFVTFV